MIEDDTLPNVVGRSIIAGITAPGQGELLKPFTPRYFAAIPGVWPGGQVKSRKRW
ncbi:aminopeptidase N domain protein [Mycobacterium xenopi 3993]|nr:aminopeptidase N domain protein [Mycobacterium xenopi 3993]